MTIKRKITEYQGGDITIKGRTHFCDTQPVKIIRAIPENDDADDDDRFEVEFFNLGRTIVDGCDLHPHPESHLSNVEFITDLMENSMTAMTQGVVITALSTYAADIAARKPEDCGSP